MQRQPLSSGGQRPPRSRRPGYPSSGSQLRDSAGVSPDFARLSVPGVGPGASRTVARGWRARPAVSGRRVAGAGGYLQVAVKRLLAIAALATAAAVFVARRRASSTIPPESSGTWELDEGRAPVTAT